MCSFIDLTPSARIYKVNSHENKEKTIKWEGVSKLLTGSVYKFQKHLLTSMELTDIHLILHQAKWQWSKHNFKGVIQKTKTKKNSSEVQYCISSKSGNYDKHYNSQIRPCSETALFRAQWRRAEGDEVATAAFIIYWGNCNYTIRLLVIFTREQKWSIPKLFSCH